VGLADPGAPPGSAAGAAPRAPPPRVRAPRWRPREVSDIGYIACTPHGRIAPIHRDTRDRGSPFPPTICGIAITEFGLPRGKPSPHPHTLPRDPPATCQSHGHARCRVSGLRSHPHLHVHLPRPGMFADFAPRARYVVTSSRRPSRRTHAHESGGVSDSASPLNAPRAHAPCRERRSLRAARAPPPPPAAHTRRAF